MTQTFELGSIVNVWNRNGTSVESKMYYYQAELLEVRTDKRGRAIARIKPIGGYDSRPKYVPIENIKREQ